MEEQDKKDIMLVYELTLSEAVRKLFSGQRYYSKNTLKWKLGSVFAIINSRNLKQYYKKRKT